MARTLELLLTESVDNLGIVGDVVKVRTGYARNFLLPNSLATTPTQEKIAALAARRADAERAQRELRAQREQMIQKMEGLEVTLVRSCNDQGMLYGSITQQDVCDVLAEQGYHLKPRDVRLGQTIKRVDTYHITVKVDSDLETDVTLKIQPDRELDLRREPEPAPAPAPTPTEDGEPAPGEQPEKQAKKGKKGGVATPEAEKESAPGKWAKRDPKPEGPAPDAAKPGREDKADRGDRKNKRK